MKRLAIFLGCALAAAGCSMSSEEDRLENAMRETLAARGAVKQIEMTKQGDGRMTGFAVVQPANGAQGRLDCTADRDPAKGANYYNWRCVPAIDEALLTQMEGTIRQSLAAQASVEAVEMTRQDNDHMTGYATVRDAAGNQIRANCTATRDSGDQGNFSWQCRPPGEDAAPAPADGGDGGK
jgi:hypothetical protein